MARYNSVNNTLVPPPHQQRLLEGVVPERQADSESEHQPDQAQHDAVGFAVGVEETSGEGHVRLLHVNEPEKSRVHGNTGLRESLGALKEQTFSESGMESVGGMVEKPWRA